MRLDLDVYGDQQISRELLRFEHRVDNAQPAWREIAGEIRKQINVQFTTEGQAGSGGWEALAPSTLASKAAKGLSPAILQATGALLASLTSSGGGNFEEITDSSLTFGSSIPYGKFHQSGTSKMPARKPIEFAELDRRQFTRILQKHIVRGGI